VIRVGAGLLVPTIVFAVAWPLVTAWRSGSLRLGEAVRHWAMIGVWVAGSAYITMLAFWPAAQIHPVLQPWQALTKSVNFGWNGQVRLFGELPRAMELPRYYDPLLLLLQTPEVMLVGFALALLLMRSIFQRLSASGRTQFVMLTVAALLPILAVLLGGAILFDKARHLLFAVGPLAVLAAIGWHGLASLGKWPGRFTRASLVLLLVLPAVRTVQLHPYEYVYFNELAGGPQQGYEDFGADYWFLSGWEALEGLDAHLAAQGPGTPVAAVFCPGFPQLVWEFARQHPSMRVTFDKGEADYFAVSTRVDIDKEYTGEVVARVQRHGFDFFMVKKKAPRSKRGKK
ncbi:MAG: hypothetical protein P1V35_15190, partial [Planctomycetota bacterium]|nr:hypothetical protein [Planctomycetota bacterium]